MKQKIFLKLCLVFIMAGVTSTLAVEPIFRTDFGAESLQARLGDSRLEGGVTGQVGWVNGPFERPAVRLEKSGLAFAAEALFPVGEGTVLAWVRLEGDWKENKAPVPLLSVVGNGLGFELSAAVGRESFLPPGRLTATLGFPDGYQSSVSLHDREFAVGPWYLVGLSWSRRDQLFEISLNGRVLAGRMIVPGQWPNGRAAGELLLNRVRRPQTRSPWTASYGGVEIFDRRLTAHELARIYERDAMGRIPLRTWTDRSRAKLFVEVDGTGIGEALPTVRLRQQEGAAMEIPVTPTAPEGRIFRGELSLERLPEGDYSVVGELDTKNKTWTGEEAFRQFARPEWLTSTVGKTDKVLPPWTPLDVVQEEGRVLVRCWGREYVFEGLPMPSAVTSQGSSLFAEAPVLRAKVADQDRVFRPESVKVVEATPAKVVLRSRALADGLILESYFSIEYDGMIRNDWKVIPVNGPLKVDLLEFEFALDIGKVPLMRVWGEGRRLEGEALPENWQSGFVNYFWIGDEKVGWCWFAESDQHWTESAGSALQAGYSNDRTRMVLRPLTAPTKLDSPLEFTFGFQATPVKDRGHFRRWRINSKDANVAHPVAINKAVKKYPGRDGRWGGYGFNTPVHTSMEDFRAEMEVWAKKGLIMPLYITPPIVDPASDLARDFGVQWRNPHGSHYPFSCIDTSYTDFIAWEVNRLVQGANLNSVYIDLFSPRRCENPDHGCGYERPDGSRRVTAPIFALRDFTKRLYAILHDNSVPPVPPFTERLLWVHGGMTPCLSFADAYIVGEGFSDNLKDDPNYFSLIPLETWRATYINQDAVPFVMPALGRRPSTDDQRMNVDNNLTLMGMILLHDTPLFEVYTFKQLTNRVYAVLDEFGLREPDLRFHGYWAQQELVPDDDRVKVSYYERPGRILAIAANPTGEAVETKLRIAPVLAVSSEEARSLHWKPVGRPWRPGDTATLKPEIVSLVLEAGVTDKLRIPPYSFYLLELSTTLTSPATESSP